MRVPLVDLAAQEASVADEVLAAVGEVAREARFILGPRVEAFERWLARACGVAHAIGVASGSDALELALRALGIGEGDAVVTPALSFVAAAEAIAATGARPVFCDVDPGTMNLSEAHGPRGARPGARRGPPRERASCRWTSSASARLTGRSRALATARRPRRDRRRGAGHRGVETRRVGRAAAPATRLASASSRPRTSARGAMAAPW